MDSTSPSLTELNRSTCFGGRVSVHKHFSSVCQAEMKFAVYQPPQARTGSIPVLYFLSGLTCTEENFMTKAGAQQFAAKYGLMVVVPDVSPRNTGIAGEDADWDLGSGAGFYVDATTDPWRDHYQMYSYVTEELPRLIQTHFPVLPDRQSICGHSMGGHGALICALKDPGRYRSVSAFAPIGSPSQVPWGQKAFGHYLGSDPQAWRDWDATELVLSRGACLPSILIDQGGADPFLATQLIPERFDQACAQVGQPLTLRIQAGYDHGYYFISTFIEDHIRFHATALQPE